MIRLFLALLLLSLSTLAHAQDPLQQIADQLGQQNVLRLPFEQTKRVVVLSKPLVSSGTMIFAKEHGLIWRTEKPFLSVMAITAFGIVRHDSGGTRVVMRSSEHRAAEHFSKTFLSLFSGDLDSVKSAFDILPETTAGSSSWSLRLTPKRSALRKVIAEIALRGSPEPVEFILKEANGDETRIAFHAGSPSQTELTNEDRQLFESTRQTLTP